MTRQWGHHAPPTSLVPPALPLVPVSTGIACEAEPASGQPSMISVLSVSTSLPGTGWLRLIQDVAIESPNTFSNLVLPPIKLS